MRKALPLTSAFRHESIPRTLLLTNLEKCSIELYTGNQILNLPDTFTEEVMVLCVWFACKL